MLSFRGGLLVALAILLVSGPAHASGIGRPVCYLTGFWVRAEQGHEGADGGNPGTLSAAGFGIGADWLWDKPVSVLTELRFLRKGTVVKGIVDDPIGIRADYLSVSALARFALSVYDLPYDWAHLYVAVGPRLDVLIGDGPETDLTWFDAEFESVDWGGDVAVGAAVFNLLADVRYSPSFSYCYDKDGLKVRNTAWTFALGVRF